MSHRRKSMKGLSLKLCAKGNYLWCGNKDTTLNSDKASSKPDPGPKDGAQGGLLIQLISEQQACFHRQP